jgi:hypothetical protein
MSDLLDQPLSAISAELASGKIKARTLIEAAQARHDPALDASCGTALPRLNKR